MNENVLVALIMAIPPTLAVILGFIASRRSVKRSIGAPLIRAVGYLHAKVDRLTAGQTELREGQARLQEGQTELQEGQAEVRERLARLEGEVGAQRRTLWVP